VGVLGEFSALMRRQTSFGFINIILLAGVCVTALLMPLKPAFAQNIFEALFGRLWNPGGVSAYADPNASLHNPEGSRSEGGMAFCVRLCDGRYFPIQRHAGNSPAQVCSSFCPASATKIYNGSSIDHALAADGKRYAELGTAFVYREKVVPDCTCNGRDAFGLVNTPVAEDATLRPGDIVATNGGLMAYNGGAGKQASFTPIEGYSGLSADLRRQLTETKVAPATERPAAPPATRQADAAIPARTGKNKRAQADR
jgi:hypothetical protein